jgi:7-keto-8-aminopelargonate synthetase-like enzyme
MKTNPVMDTVDQIITYAKKREIIHLSTQNQHLSDTKLLLKGKEVVSFSSCSYLGLEFSEKLTTAAKKGIDDFGTQFSSSRAYLSLGYYEELEQKLGFLFEAHVVVTPTTTLGHIASIPVLVSQSDAVIVDHQAHSSVQTAVNLVKAKNTHVELLRHNRMDLLEERILKLKGSHEKIWYMADGIYSMFGDLAPVEKIYELLDKYEQLHFYVDDAHAMSAFGKNGRGYVLGDRKIHSRMVVGTSLNKAFATGGGMLIFPTAELAQRVRNCGSTLITSGPMQPSALAAALACADLHLSGEIQAYQEELHENIRYANLLLKKHGLPNLAEPTTPIFFVAVGLPKVGYNLVNRMLEEGFYLNLGIFPAVPIKNTGVRFTITRLHTFEQIEAMIKAMAHHYQLALAEEAVTLEQVYQAFKIPMPEEKQIKELFRSGVHHSMLRTSHYHSILEVPKEEWNTMMAGRGVFDWNTMNLLERSFSGNDMPEENWDFDYVIVRDFSGKPVLGTFLTCSLMKDDMLSDEAISKDIEERRKKDPYLLTSKTLSVGSQITEGHHLYVDFDSELWREALSMLLQKMEMLQVQYGATTLMLRDFPANDLRMDDFMVDNGFFRINLPETYAVKTSTFRTDEDFLSHLSKRSKRHFKENIMRHAHKFDVSADSVSSDQSIREYYELYRSVKERSLALNTFALPYRFFENFGRNKNWEILRVSLAEGYGADEKAAAFVLAKKQEDQYHGLLVGLDYSLNAEHNVYRRAIYEVLRRASELGCQSAHLGFSADVEKKKFGATGTATCAYVQVKDNFAMAAIHTNSVRKIVAA